MNIYTFAKKYIVMKNMKKRLVLLAVAAISIYGMYVHRSHPNIQDLGLENIEALGSNESNSSCQPGGNLKCPGGVGSVYRYYS